MERQPLWAGSPLGRLLLDATSNSPDPPTLYIVVRDSTYFKDLRTLNEESPGCHFHPLVSESKPAFKTPKDVGGDSAKSSSTTSSDRDSPFAGIIALSVPAFVSEKRAAHLPHCFLFGRQQRRRQVDVILGSELTYSIARVHFGIGISRNLWWIRPIASKTVVNGVHLNPGAPDLALDPHAKNTIEFGKEEFELYCRDPALAKWYDKPSIHSLQLDDPTEASGAASVSTAWSSVTSAGPSGAADEWPTDILQLCAKLVINPQAEQHPWVPIRIAGTCSLDLVPKSLRPVVEPDENFRLRVAEVKRYLALDTIRGRGRTPLPLVRRQIQTALTALQAAPDAESGFITVKAFGHVLRHLEESHSRRLSHSILWELREHIQLFERGSGIAGEQGSDDDAAQPIRVTLPLSFQVPYNVHYGLFNVGFLRMLAPASFDPRLLRPYLARCLEIRGSPAAQGVYLPLAHLDEVLDVMQLRCDQGSIPTPADSSLDAFTHARWYLLAPTESSGVFPVDRALNLVHAPGGRFVPSSAFLAEFSPQVTCLDAQLVHNTDWPVLLDETPTLAAGSCEGCTTTQRRWCESDRG